MCNVGAEERGVRLLMRVWSVLASTEEAAVTAEGRLYERRDESRDGTGGLVGTVVDSLPDLCRSDCDLLTIATLVWGLLSTSFHDGAGCFLRVF